MVWHSIEDVLDFVKAAGEIALAEQRKLGHSDRRYKDDGSVVTCVDRLVEDYLFERIAKAYSEANILTEETARAFDPQKPYTLAVDPIDGTDVFSQGMAGWCVSVGLLDAGLTPVAGVVFAPRLELLFFADVDERATLNGLGIEPTNLPERTISAKTNVMFHSGIHHQLDLSGYPGKVRSIGSAALHLCFPLIYPGVFGVVEGGGAHVWDIAGAHAVNRSLGFDLECLGGGSMDYAGMVEGGSVGDVILGGSKACIGALRGVLRYRG
jgi:myo-inositol-1(or 4)-monophosphatase